MLNALYYVPAVLAIWSPAAEEKLAELQMQMLDPALESDYPKLMELQSAVDAEEANQDSLLERMLETETELAEYEET